jgi:hypothetical protein
MVEVLDRPVVEEKAPEAPLPRHVVVTQEHIWRGLTGEPHSCAIALAVKIDGWYISVDGNSIKFMKQEDDEADMRQLWLPLEARQFVSLFDEGDEVGPIEFDLLDYDVDPGGHKMEHWQNEMWRKSVGGEERE